MLWLQINFFFIYPQVKNTEKDLNFGIFPLQNSNFPTKSHIDQTYTKMSSRLCRNQWTNSDMENYGEYAHFGPLKIEKIEKKCKRYRQDSNSWPMAWKLSTLPTELSRHCTWMWADYCSNSNNLCKINLNGPVLMKPTTVQREIQVIIIKIDLYRICVL